MTPIVSSSNQPEIHSTKTSMMRQLIHLVSHGYTFWCFGEVSPQKTEGLSYKFIERYQTTKSSQQRYRTRKRGECNVKMVFWKTESAVLWWLLVTDGDGLIHQIEQLKDAKKRNQRITIFSDYELIKTPRTGDPAAWSWRMTEACSERWKNRIKSAVRQKDNMKLRQVLYSLQRIPGFRNLRREAFKFSKYTESEWKRSRKGPFPEKEIYIGWLGQFKKPDLISIKDLKK